MEQTTGDLTAAELTVLDAVDDAAVLADLDELVAIPSVGGSPAEVAAQRWCADRLRDLGATVDEWDIDPLVEAGAPGYPGMEVERDRAVGVVGVTGPPGTTPALALNGHTDVVPAGQAHRWPGGDPWRMQVREGMATGRGVCDMKGGVAAVLGAVRALRETGVELTRPLAVHVVSAEEDGGLGAFATLRRGHTAGACVIAEPTADSIIPFNAGALTFRLEVEGLSTHGATRTRGVSVLDKLEVVQRGLAELERRRHEQLPSGFGGSELVWPISLGTVRAGDWASTVPDLLVAEGRYGVRVGEDVDQARAVFEEAIARVCAADEWLRHHPVRVSWPGGVFASGALPEGHPLLGQVAEAAALVRRRTADPRAGQPQVTGAPYGSDLRLYAAAGVPTLQYGPGDIRFAHSTDEHVEVADVLACARVYALHALRLCS